MGLQGSTLSAGQLVGGCRIIRLLGQGGMGEVYLAEHLALQKPVAVKILPPDLGSREHVERFLKEARTCSRVEHPNVVFIHDVGEHDGVYYIVMQYVRGKTLAELLQDQGGPFPWRSALKLTQLAATGLHAVHAQGLVHRDVKPSNIMLSVDSRVLMMDFGLVREERDSSLTRSGQIVGTPSFMSPEQCRGQELDRRSDIYSLGSTLYCLLTAQPPFRGNVQEVLTQIAGGTRPRPVHEVRPDVPLAVSELVAKAMAPRPEDRFPDAASMARELRKLLRAALLKETSTLQTAELSGGYVETQSISRLPPVELLPLETRTEWLQRKLPVIGAVAGVLVVLLLSGWLVVLLSRPGERETPPVSRPTGPPDAPPETKKADLKNMVRIEPGYARLGNSPEKLKGYCQSIPEMEDRKIRETFLKDVTEPQQRVLVPGFWIDKYEVTNAEYARFVKDKNYEPPEGWDGRAPPAGQADHPVRNIRHRDAETYAAWAGKKLPTREQWTRAFRGDSDQLFPWGDEFDASRANVRENDRFPSASPVDATPRDVTPFGVCNMVGNVSEYLREKGTVRGRTVVYVKGAHYNANGRYYGVGCMDFWFTPNQTDAGFGFRCVVEEPLP